MTETDNDPRRLIATIERAADILTLFTRIDRTHLGVTEIAQELDLSKAVVHRVLTTLAAKGLVSHDPASRKYGLGPTVLSLAVTYLDRLDLRELAAPLLQELSERTHETATLSLRYGAERMYVDQVTPAREVKMTVRIGQPFPLHAGSSGKAFLAHLEPDEQDRYLADDLAVLTSATIADAAQLRDELVAVRERGYAVSFGERQEGAGSVAAPVLDHRNAPAAVISVCGPLERFRDEVDDVAGLLLDTTRRLSATLGHRRT